IHQAIDIATIVVSSGASFKYLIELSPINVVLRFIDSGGPWYFVAGLLCLSFASQRRQVMYWTVQISIWIAGFALWYPQSWAYTPFPVNANPTWLIVSAICSLLLLVLYKPSMRLLQRLVAFQPVSATYPSAPPVRE